MLHRGFESLLLRFAGRLSRGTASSSRLSTRTRCDERARRTSKPALCGKRTLSPGSDRVDVGPHGRDDRLPRLTPSLIGTIRPTHLRLVERLDDDPVVQRLERDVPRRLLQHSLSVRRERPQSTRRRKAAGFRDLRGRNPQPRIPSMRRQSRPASMIRSRNWRAARLGRGREDLFGRALPRITPASRKQTRLAMSRAKPISCVAISMVIPPAASSRITFSTSATSSGSSALVTSSSSITSGRSASARTIATRCCWPPDSRSG